MQYRNDRTLWHERMLLAQVAGPRWLSLSPDEEILDETYEISAGPDSFSGVRIIKSNRQVTGIAADDVYKFENLHGQLIGAKLLQEYLTEAEELAEGIRSSLVDGDQGGAGGDGALLPAGAGLVAAAIQGLGPAPEGRAPAREASAGLVGRSVGVAGGTPAAPPGAATSGPSTRSWTASRRSWGAGPKG